MNELTISFIECVEGWTMYGSRLLINAIFVFFLLANETQSEHVIAYDSVENFII